jgi:hypothetical protein
MMEALRRIEGLFVGQLKDDEVKLFNAGYDLGLCYQSYEGTAGLLGLSEYGWVQIT